MKSKLLLGLVAAGLTADAVRRRKRLSGLRTLPDSAVPVADDHYFLTAEGVRIDEATKRAASAYARQEGLDVVDLVPAELDAASSLDLARRYDPGSYRSARLALGVGAGHALLATADVLGRARFIKFEDLDAVEIAEVTAHIKRFAAVTTDLAVAPGLRAVDRTHAARSATVRKNWRENTPALLTGQFLVAAALVVAARRNPRWGLAALTAWCLQPYLATAGTPLRPHDRVRFAAPPRRDRPVPLAACGHQRRPVPPPPGLPARGVRSGARPGDGPLSGAAPHHLPLVRESRAAQAGGQQGLPAAEARHLPARPL